MARSKPIASEANQDYSLEDGGIWLHLETFCLETTARRARQALVERLLAGELGELTGGPALELLDGFLSQTDFGRERAQNPELAGGQRIDLWLSRNNAGRVVWEIVRDAPTRHDS